MPRVAVHDSQLTLPDELREAVQLGRDDYVEAELVEGGILLRPSPEANRRAALARIRAAQSRVRMAPELAALPPEERERKIVEWLEEDEGGDEHA